MTFFRGRMPSAFLLAALLFSSVVQAQYAVPLTLAEAEDLALDREPGREALRALADALAERSVVAGQLPDPALRIGIANYPIQSGGFSTEGMTQAQLALRQSFPSGKSRDFDALRFSSLSQEAHASADARARDVLTHARVAWLEVYYWQHARIIVTESRPFFADLAKITRSLYAVGKNTQQDVFRAELELGRLDDRLIELERRHQQAIAALSEWLGPEANRVIASTLPDWARVPDLHSLQTAVDAHPVVAAANAKVAARSAAVNLAEENKKPDWSIDIGYGYRDGTLSTGDPRSDFVSVSVTTQLPFFRENRQDRSLAAALRERSAAEYEQEQLRRRLLSRVDAEYVRWQDLTRRLVLFETRILELSEDHAQAALLAYQSEAGDFADVMRGYIDELNTRLDHVRLKVERAQSYAALANLGGFGR